MEKQGQRNAYKCEKCGKEMVTVNLTDGVTPFIVKCRANWPGQCGGMSQSRVYRIDQATPATWGWYRPNDTELDALEFATPGVKEHVAKGGLMLRKLDNAERETYGGPRVRHG